MVAQHFKDWVHKNGPFYAPISINPLDYHGYKYTDENIKDVVEEIEYELSLYPQYADILLDHILNVKAKSPAINHANQ